MKTITVFPDEVQVGERHRKHSQASINALAESIKELGLQNPIHVTVDDDGTDCRLVAGAGRLAAVIKLGWEEVEAFEVDMDEIDAELWEIDENLCRAELTEVEKAQHLSRRKELFERRPLKTPDFLKRETGQSLASLGGRGNKGFAQDTAERTGQSKSSVNSAVSRGERIAPDVLDSIRGTDMDKGVELDALKRLTHEEQRRAVERVTGGAEMNVRDAARFIKGGPVNAPAPPLNDFEAVNKQLSRIVTAWNAAGPEARTRFINEYVDTPIADMARATA